MTSTFKTLVAGCACAVSLMGALPAQASVVIAGTRVIYHATDAEVTIKLSNEGQTPALTQSWIDSGDLRAAPSAIDVPFMLTPPVSRIDPGKAQTLRIVYTGEPLPQDRESVFWLNVLEVPPRPAAEDADSNKLQLAFRSRIKLFFRPSGLKDSAADAPAAIRWRMTRAGSHAALEAHNPTAYHVSFSGVELLGGGKTARSEDGSMVAPGKTAIFQLAGDAMSGADSKVRYRAISDYGGEITGEAMLDTSVPAEPPAPSKQDTHQP
ncbi:fimbrial chaperone [Cupriavidus sp. TA19]|uniref:fimbria/pilus periplasmic chaperone n=1 Tax=unclassified Cupriavidus TaxID=2640874 RepID=UPI000E2E7C95|nr:MULTISPECIES: fimbria/pilus periplasmic chaperone [unclassified Cupriavidus]BDB27589.1 fimbria/pilus periplasmic chaperone [Cupriavidus sp. P-10]GLC91635.1 fimbrial chaperone [Cupriavidus sp. TA19]